MTVDESKENGVRVVGRQWLSVHYEGDTAQVIVHAAHTFGAREATAHVEVEASEALLSALQETLNDALDDVSERALDAASEHRTLARNRGEDHRGEQTTVGYEEVTEDMGIYSDPRLMDMPVKSRQRALERSQQAMQEARDD